MVVKDFCEYKHTRSWIKNPGLKNAGLKNVRALARTSLSIIDALHDGCDFRVDSNIIRKYVMDHVMDPAAQGSRMLVEYRITIASGHPYTTSSLSRRADQHIFFFTHRGGRTPFTARRVNPKHGLV